MVDKALNHSAPNLNLFLLFIVICTFNCCKLNISLALQSNTNRDLETKPTFNATDLTKHNRFQCHANGTASRNSDNGNCICLQKVIGHSCDQCIENHFGLTQFIGCKSCDCNSNGSKGPKCDADTGQCICLDGYRGRTCNDCDTNYIQIIDNGILSCIPCNCHPKMSQISSINSKNEQLFKTRCANLKNQAEEYYCRMNLVDLERSCDLITGQCNCKQEATGHQCDRCAPRYAYSISDSACFPCDSCSSTLMDFLDEISLDLDYANRTIEKNRLSATLGFRLGELESALNDHSLGFKNSLEMLENAIRSMRSNLAIETNLTSDKISLYIDGQELEASTLEAKIAKLRQNSTRDYDIVDNTIARVNQTFEDLEFIKRAINSSHNELQLINENYVNSEEFPKQNTNNPFMDLIIFDNLHTNHLMHDSWWSLKNQTDIGVKLDNLLKDLASRIIILENSKLDVKDSVQIQAEQLIGLMIFNISIPTEECGSFSDRLESLIYKLNISTSITKAQITTKLANAHQLLDTNNKLVDNESWRVNNLTSYLNNQQIKLKEVSDMFKKSCLKSFEQLSGELDINNTNHIDLGFSLLRNTTLELNLRTANLTKTLESDLKPKQYQLTEQYYWLSRNLQNIIKNWENQIDVSRATDDIMNRLIFLNETLDNVGKSSLIAPVANISNVSSVSSLPDVKKKLLDVRRTTLDFGSELNKADQRFSKIKREFMQINLNASTDKASKEKILKSQLVDTMEESRILDQNITAWALNISQVVAEFSEKRDRLFGATLSSQGELESDTNTLDSLPIVEDLASNSTIFIANNHFDEIKARFKQHNNYLKVLNSTNHIIDKISNSISDLQYKIRRARLILNHIELERNSNDGPIRLKNPTDINDFSTYISLSIDIKPRSETNGLLFFIGTPEARAANIHNISGNSTDYQEYLALEMRDEKISVALNLGSKFVELIEDDVYLKADIWHRIDLMRSGSLLSISVKSNISSSSLTRLLTSPHVMLDIDTSRTEIFVGGISGLVGNCNDMSNSTIRTIPGIQSRSCFSGSINNVVLNDRKFSLWNTQINHEVDDYSQKYLEKIEAYLARNLTDQLEDKNSSIPNKNIGICPDSSIVLDSGEYNAITGNFQFSNGYLVLNTIGNNGTKYNSYQNRTNTTYVNQQQMLLVSVISFSFKTSLQNVPLVSFFTSDKSNEFVAIQLNSGQLEIIVADNETILSSRSQKQQQTNLPQYSVTDNFWHNLEFNFKVNVTSQLIVSGQLRLDKNQIGQVSLSRKLDSVRPRKIYIGAGSEQLELSSGLRPMNGSQEVANYLVAANFTGCLKSFKSFWSDDLKDLVRVNFYAGVRERGCREQARIVSFPRSKSNISSSYIQIMNSESEYDDILIENVYTQSVNMSLAMKKLAKDGAHPMDHLSGQIRSLTIRFKSLQQNGLLVHHSRPDHSSFMSVYIFGGRLMVAVNFDKKIRFESHVLLSDGQWHTLRLMIRRYLQELEPSSKGNASSSTASQAPRFVIRHSIRAILDDRYMYKDRFNVDFEPEIRSPDHDYEQNGAGQVSFKRFVLKSAPISMAMSLSLEAADVNPTNPVASGPSIRSALESDVFGEISRESADFPVEQLKKILYFGGVEDKYTPLLRNLEIPTNFHGCLADVTINELRLSFAQSNKNQGVIMNQCQLND